MEKVKTTREKVFTNKLLPVILMTLNLSFFFYLIPGYIAEEYSVSLAIIGGFITMILSFWVFGVLTPKLYDKIPIFMGIFCISTLFIFGYFFIMKATNYGVDQLSKNGLLAKAVIIDKTKIYGRRNSTQNIDVQFITNKGQQATAEILISEAEYDLLYEGQTITIRYSSEHPNIAAIIYDRSAR